MNHNFYNPRLTKATGPGGNPASAFNSEQSFFAGFGAQNPMTSDDYLPGSSSPSRTLLDDSSLMRRKKKSLSKKDRACVIAGLKKCLSEGSKSKKGRKSKSKRTKKGKKTKKQPQEGTRKSKRLMGR